MIEIAVKHIECLGEKLLLTNQKAVFWEREHMLVIADLHLGKTAHFRKHGIAIPSTVMMQDLERLSALIMHFHARQLVIVGDMFHASYNRDLELFAIWRDNFPKLDIILVKGNHDRLSDEQYRQVGINLTCPELNVHPLVMVHEFIAPGPTGFTLCGHLHPGKVIYGPARQTLRLPCFILAEDHMVLPAFSQFTGLDTSRFPENMLACFVVTDKGVFEIQEN
jgi:DNA ligase-associated metallophosphoesterase